MSEQLSCSISLHEYVSLLICLALAPPMLVYDRFCA